VFLSFIKSVAPLNLRQHGDHATDGGRMVLIRIGIAA
jgi:hypothetical protein